MTNTQAMAALEPCPFCGSDRVTIWNVRDGQQAVCKDCKATAAAAFNGPADMPTAWERARQAWNRRASSLAGDAEPVAVRIGRAEVKGGSVGFFAFEQTDLPDGEYPLYAVPAPPAGDQEKVGRCDIESNLTGCLHPEEHQGRCGYSSPVAGESDLCEHCGEYAHDCGGHPIVDSGDADEAYEIGKRDGYEAAIADVDRLTGGDGEYFASTIPGRGCPDWQTMMVNIVERFESATPAAGDAELRKALEKIDKALWSVSGKRPKRDPQAFVELADEIEDIVTKALATPPSVPAQQGWLPIETAPKTGEPVLIWKPDERMVGEYMMVAYWDDDYSAGEPGWVPVGGVHKQGYASSVTGTPQGYPTHWMPLPATPPAQGRKTSE